ncbi:MULTISPECIES: Maf family nucleotide pyrophosphatase [unclassified Roseitalea]|uniref:Maf family nucleotide pyrophosphatase n=1 Tax=unclassified Roseitalea TaxID=2639107 RepID=UPI00273FB330|nr:MULTISPECIES: Maf family nucleotide pyrophosphatase [unclassified Roseitalea]
MSVLQTLVLASASPRRLDLMMQAGIEPDRLLPTHIDETPHRAEHPRSLARRLSLEKARAALKIVKDEQTDADRQAIKDGTMAMPHILAADTVVARGSKVMPKADTVEDATHCLRMLSGRTHRVYTGLAVIGPSGKTRQRIVETRVRFRRLPRSVIDSYIASDEWRGKAGGYAIQGLAGTFVVKLVGSYTNVVGLPLAETVTLLGTERFDVYMNWHAGGAR